MLVSYSAVTLGLFSMAWYVPCQRHCGSMSSPDFLSFTHLRYGGRRPKLISMDTVVVRLAVNMGSDVSDFYKTRPWFRRTEGSKFRTPESI